MDYYTKQECELYIKQLNKEYKDNHLKEQERDLLIQENNIENDVVKGYHGREILELLQNADDAYQKSINNNEKPECDLEVTINYEKNILTISNTGTLFDKDGIKSIIQGNQSPKIEDSKYIGCKGTGFRSILNWAEKIRIFSGNFNVEFSNKIAEEFLSSIKNEKQIKKQLIKQTNIHIPMLSVPLYIEKDQKYEESNTTIEITIDPNKVKDAYSVEKQINNLDKNILLFLPNISSININDNGKSVKYSRERVNENKKVEDNHIDSYSIIQINQEIEQQKENLELDVFERETSIFIDNKERNIKLAIAIPDNLDKLENCPLYSFFPILETKTPFNCIMHATYDLSSQRNTILKNDTNKKIIVEQLKFLVDVICDNYITKQRYEEGIELLIPRDFLLNSKEIEKSYLFDIGFNSFEVENLYINMVANKRIFKNVNDKFVSLRDHIKIIVNDFPQILKGEIFGNLLKSFCNKNIYDYIKFLSKYLNLDIEINEQELSDNITSISKNWDVNERVLMFDWWCQNFNNTLPKLLKNQNGEWLNFKEVCYFLDGNFDDLSFPQWTKYQSLNLEYQKELFNIIKKRSDISNILLNNENNSLSRIICQNKIYNNIDFRYIDRTNIVNNINQSVDNFEKAIEFVKWLWENFDHQDWAPASSLLPFNFPADNQLVVKSNKIYFGESYGNKLSSQLFDENYYQFPKIELFNIKEEEKQEFIKFICKFGVLSYPIIKRTTVDAVDLYKNKIKELIYIYGDMGVSNYLSLLSITVFSIDNIVNIINNLTTQDIVKWLNYDINLRMHLSNKFEKQEWSYELRTTYSVQYMSRSQSKKRDLIYNYIPNYILFIFNYIPWIKIGGNKYAPTEIVYDYNSKANNNFKELVPVINKEFITKLSTESEILEENIKEIFELFNFCKNITELSSNKFYEIMLNIPNCYNSAEISRAVYRIILQETFNKEFEDSENKQKFFKEGKLLTTKSKFVDANMVTVPSINIINKDSYDILAIPQRSNTKKFIKLFGCQEYNKDIKIDKESIVISPNNDIFQKEFHKFKQYANAYVENDSYSNMKNIFADLSIELVEQIQLIVNGEIEKDKDKYDIIKDSIRHWYIIDNDKYNKNEISVRIENILSNIENTPLFDSRKYGELFRVDDEQKEFLIKRDYGSTNFIHDINYAQEIKNKFTELIKEYNENIELDNYEIDFQNFKSDDSISKIIRLFQDLNIKSIKEIYLNGFPQYITFNLRSYYNNILHDLKNKYERQYKSNLYKECINDKRLQKDFIKNIQKYKDFEWNNEDKILNITNYFFEEFGLSNTIDMIDVDEMYKKNYETLNPNNMYVDEISNNYEIKNMIYFNKTIEFNDWLLKMDKTNKEELDDNYTQYVSTISKETPIKFNSNHMVDNKKQYNSNKIYNPSEKERESKNKKRVGNKAELIIYNTLCNDSNIGKENVFPKSEAFVTLGILKSGQAESCGYDIMYKEKNTGEIYYVEVKTDSHNTFFMSAHELEFAKKYPQNYRIYVVSNINNSPTHIIIKGDFFKDTAKYQIIPNIESYTITY